MIPLQHILILAIFLFIIGLTTLIIRKNFLFTLIGLEITMISVSLSFIIAGNHWEQADGHIMFIITISSAASEISIGLSLLLKLYRHYNTLNIDSIHEMKE